MPNVGKYAKRYGIPLKLAHALLGQENASGNPNAVSSKGATGLTQVMPGTAAGMLGVSPAKAAQMLKNPDVALDLGFRYLAQQKKTFGTWRLALAAYNAGPGAVSEFHGIPPYQETQNYVNSIMSRVGSLKPTKMGTIPSSPLRGKVSVPGLVPPAGRAPVLGNTYDPRMSLVSKLASGSYNPVDFVGELSQARQSASAAPQGDMGLPGLPSPSQGRRAAIPGLQPLPFTGQDPGFRQLPLAKGDYGKFVKLSSTADRQGVRTNRPVLQFVGLVGKMYGAPLEIGTGTNHDRMTVNGNVSDHWVGNAADIPSSGDALTRLGRTALVAAGMSRKKAAKIDGGLFNLYKGGRRYQIIFNTTEGGNHWNHLHVGVRPAK